MTFNDDQLTNEYINTMVRTAQGYVGSRTEDRWNREVEARDLEITEKKIYEAFLTTTLVVRDGILEETITDTLSETPEIDVHLIGNQYSIYIIASRNQMLPEGGLAILLPTIRDSRGVCIGLGPAWIGRWGAGEIMFYKQIKWKDSRNPNKTKWIFKTKYNHVKATKSIFLKDGVRTKNAIKFVLNTDNLLFNVDDFRVVKIYDLGENKFGGKKPIEYDITKIFDSTDALRFKKK